MGVCGRGGWLVGVCASAASVHAAGSMGGHSKAGSGTTSRVALVRQGGERPGVCLWRLVRVSSFFPLTVITATSRGPPRTKALRRRRRCSCCCSLGRAQSQPATATTLVTTHSKDFFFAHASSCGSPQRRRSWRQPHSPSLCCEEALPMQAYQTAAMRPPMCSASQRTRLRRPWTQRWVLRGKKDGVDSRRERERERECFLGLRVADAILDDARATLFPPHPGPCSRSCSSSSLRRGADIARLSHPSTR